MEKNEHDKITAFDTLYTNNHIQMLKIVMPYFDEQMRRKLAVYIKYLELRHTLDCYHSHSYELSGCSFEKEEFNINKICSELIPFCTGEEKRKLEQIADIFRTIETYKEISRTMEIMKDFAPDLFTEGAGNIFSAGTAAKRPEGEDGDSANNNDTQSNGIMEMLMGMLSPEQKAMFEMFGGNHTHDSK